MLTERVTKLDAAQRQTNEAIRMFFEGRDTVSIHTLASAAAEILADLGNDRGFAGFTRNPNLIVEHRRKDWKNAIKRYENFFKHANKDATDTCDFCPEMTQMTLIESVWMLRFLTGKMTWEALIYLGWSVATYPDLFLDGDLKRHVITQSAQLNVDLRDRRLSAELIRLRPALPLDGIL